MNYKIDTAIIGGGIIGLATAYKLQQLYPYKNIVIFEKEKELAYHQTGHNSGVIHSGLYYEPGSKRAQNCIEGRKQLIDFAKKNRIPYKICGKIVVATTFQDIIQLQKLYANGLGNGLKNIQYIVAKDIHKYEPKIRGKAAIFVPNTGVINYVDVAKQLALATMDINHRFSILYEHEVIDITDKFSHVNIKTKHNNFTVGNIIICAGLQADRLANKARRFTDQKLDIRIVPFRGDYYKLVQESPGNCNPQIKLNALVYPVPNIDFPFLGVHFTKGIDRSMHCGPNAVFSFSREGYNKFGFNIKDTFDALTYEGTWRLFFKHWKLGLKEYKRALSKKLFYKELLKMYPQLMSWQIKPSTPGIRAIALRKDGTISNDLYLKWNGPRILNVLNASSPAATSCLAIADEILEEFKKNLVSYEI